MIFGPRQWGFDYSLILPYGHNLDTFNGYFENGEILNMETVKWKEVQGPFYMGFDDPNFTLESVDETLFD